MEAPCETNETMMQGFEWYCPADHQHWRRLIAELPRLSQLGITSLWIPPAAKASWHQNNGYDIYDLYDLGEFAQKGSIATKWGTKDELVNFTQRADQAGIKVLYDAVLNHKAAADGTEKVKAIKIDAKDRAKTVGKIEEIEVWTRFDFPGRQRKYDNMKWDARHFTGIDYSQTHGANQIWQFEGKKWADDVDEELGNYDYLMFADIDHDHPDVRQNLLTWTGWLNRTLRLGGMRLDAIKHLSARFIRDLLAYIDSHVSPSWLIVGEYWRDDADVLSKYIEYMGHRLLLFDVPLVCNFSKFSIIDGGDLRKLLSDTLAAVKPRNAVTFVANHDTQPGQSLETLIAPYFVPLAYAIILLQRSFGVPCIFYGDLYGHFNGDKSFTPPIHGGLILPRLMLARHLYAYGPQHSYFDEPHCIGFTREGHSSRAHGAGIAVILTNAWRCVQKSMFVGQQHADELWVDLLQQCPSVVKIGHDGWAEFSTSPRSVSVWACVTASGREVFEARSSLFDGLRIEVPLRSAADAAIAATIPRSMPPWLAHQQANLMPSI